MPTDDFLLRLSTALSDIERAAADNVERSLEIQRRVHWFHQQIDDGVPIGSVVASEHEPRMVELISANMATLENVGSGFRASLAMALRDDGLTIEAIATLFGVTRQRISALLRQKAALDAAAAPSGQAKPNRANHRTNG